MFTDNPIGHWQRRRRSRAAERSAGHQQGMSIVEVMVSMTVGLLVLSFLTVIFVNSSNTRREIDKSADIYENGRYGLLVLGDELSHAGYYGTLSAVSPGATTDLPCSTTVADWESSLALAVRGSNHSDMGIPLGLFDCINGSRKTDTDVLFLQRAATCVAGVGACAGLVAADIYVQVSECGAEYSTNPFVLAANSGLPYTLQDKDCTPGTLAPVRKFIRRIFFVGSDDRLQYVDIGPLGAGPPVPLAENIENMQVEYGVDTNGDSSPDCFASVPADCPPVTAGWWTQVVGARIWLLARAPQVTAGYTDDKTYTMGDLDAAAYAAGLNTGYKRHVFTGYFNFVNPQGRME
ncbi:MAG: PilW family protein [Pseudomonadota bacterium]|nr:PilW family protein [Pseudomonadota bacterium]